MNNNLYTQALWAITILSGVGCGQSGSGAAAHNDAAGGSPDSGGTTDNGGASAVGGESGMGGSFAVAGSSSVGGAPATGVTAPTGGTLNNAGGGAANGSSGGTTTSSFSSSSMSSGGASSTTDAGTTTSLVCGGGSAQAGDVVVTLSSRKQRIAGFGASTAWGSTMSSNDADLLWSTSKGAGLSLHRVRIDYKNGHTGEVQIAQQAVARGVTVWATPWTPPVADKSNNSSVAGTLTDGQAFATFLAGFVTYMKGQGVDIYAVSAQNEPDANVTYESCSYTGATIAAFVGTYMGPTLAPMGVKVMAPETQNWCSFANYLNPILNDANANKYTDIIATHEYGCTSSIKAYPQIAQAGKEFWETEIYDSNGTEDAGMGSALRVAKLIHDALTIANMNAWHYWCVYPSSADNGALWDKATGQPSKRLWIMGNFSRFVRPGYQRVDITGTAPTGVLLSAYSNPADASVAVVAINNNTSAQSLSVFVSGMAACAVTPWVTSSNDALAAKTSVSVTDSRFSYSLDPQSVTTFVATP